MFWLSRILKQSVVMSSGPAGDVPGAVELVEQGIAAENRGQTAQAIRYFRLAVGADSNYAPAHMNLAIALHAAGELDAAAASHRQAIRLAPGSAAAHFNYALTLLDAREPGRAETEFREALRLRHEFPDAYVGLADALDALGREVDALAALESAVGQRSNYVGARFNASILLRRMGQVKESEAMLRQIDLAALLPLPDRHAELESVTRRIVDAWPQYAPGWKSLGTLLALQRRFMDAVPALQAALELSPSDAEAHNNLGVAFQSLGKFTDAETCYRRALELKSDYDQAHNNLGKLLFAQGLAGEAEPHFRRALELSPGFCEAHRHLGAVFESLGRSSEAEESYRRALELEPDSHLTHNNLGVALQSLGRLTDAVASFRHALSLAPDYQDAQTNLGNALQALRRLTEAEACYRRALELKPDAPATLSNLGSALRELGRVDEAEACFRRAIALDPAYSDAHSNLLFTLNNTLHLSRAALFDEHLEWARRHEPLAGMQRQPHGNVRDPDRRLRIGYVSPDFRRHSVAYFIEPVLAGHDHAALEVFCYSNVAKPDDTTRRLLGLADCARSIVGMSDASAAELVRADRIDILVDLAGHTARGRLGVFALKPAPVQVGYLGYPNTSGLAAIDWRLTDNQADPQGDSDAFYSERLTRLPKTFLCFRPPGEAPEPQLAPCFRNNYVTFGSFNILAKLAPEVIAAWSRLLERVHGSRLLLKAPGLGDQGGCSRLLRLFAQQGIGEERLTLLPADGDSGAHLARYHEVDVGLDPFPYNGTTTTCEALWMGVPVVTFASDRHAGRTGASILANLGLDALVAANPQDYVALAADLACDSARLSLLRGTMRERMRASPLRDEAGFAHAIQSAYRAMWRHWCGI